jgi:hypothetical protein
VSFKHPIAAADVEPDQRPRALFLDRCRVAGGAHLPRYMPLPMPPAESALAFRGACGPAIVGKQITLRDNRLTVRYEVDIPEDGEFETQINLALPSCDGFLGRYVFEGQVPGGFGAPLELPSVTTLALEDQLLGGTLEVLCSVPMSISARPHHTVSQSEDGFEKVMQAIALTLRCPLEAGSSSFAVALEVRRA